MRSSSKRFKTLTRSYSPPIRRAVDRSEEMFSPGVENCSLDAK
jgi:hypothetical protein